MSTTRTPITREAFILPSHVQVALRGHNFPHAPAMMTVVSDQGEMSEVPVPFQCAQQGVLPEGFAVDFLFDPEEVVAKLKNAGMTCMEDVPEQVFQKMAEVVNGADNLKIVPIWLYNQKRGLISSAVSQGVTPEVVIEQKRRQAMQETEAEAAAVEGEQGNSSSGQRKEKKKGFLKGIFGKK